MSDSIQSISYVKAHLAEVIDSVRESHDPVVISQNGASTAVIIDHESFKRTQDCMALLKLAAMGEVDIEEKRTRSQKDVFKSLRKKLNETDA